MPTPRRASPWRLAALVALAALVCSVARAQEELQLDDAGNTIAVSIVTDANGDPLQTLVLSTLTTDAPVAEETTTTTTADVADPVADDTPTETTTLPTTTAAATTTEAGPVDVGQPGNVLTPASRCTTAGCPVAPTTYTQGGVIVTWYATTPATPQPQVTSSGVILGVGSCACPSLLLLLPPFPPPPPALSSVTN
ncbi:hypothetical protein DMC30DRAFT_271846 [Rhodotorula diobovata]|uniref:Uncharacterized protein n=1 Tax=Rhodotorula diobovata TaxID=5288 RepID=A0A5C5FUY5_9BASI|nr:hypothetical protein DMC30DRAFT_271846 [Rhodotorula diobovata]